MTEKQFMEQLDANLSKVSAEERQDMLEDYQEHFAMGKAEGKTEEMIAEALGSPEKIAKELLANYHVEKAEANTTTGNVMRAVWAGIGLGFFNLIIVLGPFIGLVSVILSGWVVGLTFLLMPLAALAKLVIFPGSFVYFDLFFSLAFSGLGLFIVIGMYYVTKVVIRLFIQYLKFNISFVKGGMKHE